MHDIYCKTVWGCRTLRDINGNYMIYRCLQNYIGLRDVSHIQR